MKLGKFTSKVEPLWTVALVPIWQEFVFRYLPFQFWYMESGNFWLVGLASAFVFALIHWYFGKWFTAAAFVAGLLYWWVMVSFGFFGAVLAHAIVNVIDLTFGIRYFITKLEK